MEQLVDWLGVLFFWSLSSPMKNNYVDIKIYKFWHVQTHNVSFGFLQAQHLATSTRDIIKKIRILWQIESGNSYVL